MVSDCETRSSDGTAIRWRQTGAGPHLLLVHGSVVDSSCWDAGRPLLEEHFTVHAMDRRGHGRSGWTDEYSIDREEEDILAVMAAIGEPCHLLGHSYGAICVLGAALRATNLDRLVLYEPPLPVEGPTVGPALLDYKAAVERGDNDGALAIACEHFLRMSPSEIAGFRDSPAWQPTADYAPSWVPELAEIDALGPDVSRYARLTMPTALLLGTESPGFMAGVTAALSRTIPHARVFSLPGQGHDAPETSPELFASTVVGLLAGPWPK